MSDKLDRERREMHAVLQQPGLRPDDSVQITRRTFVTSIPAIWGRHRRPDLRVVAAYQHPSTSLHAAEPAFKFAGFRTLISIPSLSTRVSSKSGACGPGCPSHGSPRDFRSLAATLPSLARSRNLSSAMSFLKDVKIPKYFIPGEHDGISTWARSGPAVRQAHLSFDHKGVRFIGRDTVSRGPDYWTAKNMTPEEAGATWRPGRYRRGRVGRRWPRPLDWLENTLADWDKNKPVVIRHP